jgi:4-amino-4-deoxy-L-arabinose transferase-like glycosyltransferase
MTSGSESNLAARPAWEKRASALAPWALILIALLVRLAGAYSRFLNADEAMHYLFSLQPSFIATYRATLWTAHPPLLLILVHYWSLISSSEFFLRLPSVIAGTASGWFVYAWLRRVTDSCAALIALALLLFSPALIYLSFEIRQYALVMMFMTASLYFLDRALMEGSAGLMLASILALYLALSTHYCTLIFAPCVACYALLRMWSLRSRPSVISVWTAGQVGGIALAAVFWKTHITYIRSIGMVQHVAESYLRASLFQRGEENVLHFILRANIRVFRFLFSQGAVAVLAMLLFFVAIVFLLRENSAEEGRKPSPRQLGLLLLLPFVLNCVAALLGAYPYGASRHNSYLAIFAMPAIATLVARWRLRRSWIKPAAIAAALGICNFTITPAGAYIPASHQKKGYMHAVADWVRASVPPHSLILADYESGLLAGYYICGKNIVQTVPPYQLFLFSECGNYESATLIPPLWVFNADMFPEQMRELKQTLIQNHKPDESREVWLFQAGYIVDKEPKFRTLLADYGCIIPRQFGPNILVCRISIEKK